MKSYSHSKDQSYVVYDSELEVKDLDLNKWHGNQKTANEGFSGMEHIYAKSMIYGAPYICSHDRNKNVHYIIDVERDDHPDHSSRFGYARFPNGYGVGSWSPGFYNTPPACAFDPLPPNMAPSRFYTAPYIGPNRVDTQATEDYNNLMKTFTKPLIY